MNATFAPVTFAPVPSGYARQAQLESTLKSVTPVFTIDSKVR